MSSKFPHINRKLTAVFLLTLFLLIVVLNLAQNQLFKTSDEKRLRFQLLQNPQISLLHEKLGQYYLVTDETAAKREYLLAQEYYSPIKALPEAIVSGNQFSPWQTWQNLTAKKHSLANEQHYWENVSETYPDYLYAYLKLALINLQKGDTIRAKDYLATILRDDPTNIWAAKLLSEIK